MEIESPIRRTRGSLGSSVTGAYAGLTLAAGLVAGAAKSVTPRRRSRRDAMRGIRIVFTAGIVRNNAWNWEGVAMTKWAWIAVWAVCAAGRVARAEGIE